jgi:hypothetical protein
MQCGGGIVSAVNSGRPLHIASAVSAIAAFALTHLPVCRSFVAEYGKAKGCKQPMKPDLQALSPTPGILNGCAPESFRIVTDAAARADSEGGD